MFLTPWFLESDPNKFSVIRMHIWVHLWNLPLQFQSLTVMEDIGNTFCRYIKEEVEKAKVGLATHACICVDRAKAGSHIFC
jgi:hypothetical protein